MNDKDKIVRDIILSLTEKGYSVALLLDGEILVNFPLNDFTIKVTKKKKRII
jgi:hypothetical protein